MALTQNLQEVMSPEDYAEYQRLLDEANFYDRLQYVYKIKLNS